MTGTAANSASGGRTSSRPQGILPGCTEIELLTSPAGAEVPVFPAPARAQAALAHAPAQ